MVRFLISTVIAVLASAVGLLIAAAVLDDMTVTGKGFVVAVLIFTAVNAIATPFLANMARKGATALLGAVALISTVVALIVTHAISDSISIKGLDTWVFAGVIVWLAGLVAAIIIPVLLVKAGVQSARNRNN
jgi:MFS family permease